jgi:hypothetical protein
MANYLAELDALGRWLMATANLGHVRLQEAPPTVTRPVAAWEAPDRVRDRPITKYVYVTKVTQYGKLLIRNLDDLVNIQELLLDSLEELDHRLPVYDSDAADAKQVGTLENVEITFNTSDNTDVPFNVKYEATYTRTAPPDPGPATTVGTSIKLNF